MTGFEMAIGIILAIVALVLGLAYAPILFALDRRDPADPMVSFFGATWAILIAIVMGVFIAVGHPASGMCGVIGMGIGYVYEMLKALWVETVQHRKPAEERDHNLEVPKEILMGKKGKGRNAKRKKQKLTFAEELERGRLVGFYGHDLAVQLLEDRPRDQLDYLHYLHRARAAALLRESVSSW